MITNQPFGRHDLKIKKGYRVLEIGCGHNPMYRSNVLTDKYTSDDSHRCGSIRIYPHQTFVEAAGEKLPFEDKAFDYVICNQVLEHAENPDKFIAEIVRVGRRGYIETPSVLGEMLFPKSSHKWVIQLIDNKMVFFEKAKMPGNYGNNYGELFLNYLPYQSLPFKILWASEPQLMVTSFEWNDDVELLVNPTDDYYSSFFTKPWNREMTRKLFPPRSGLSEFRRTLRAGWYIGREKLAQKLCKRPATRTLEDHLAARK